MDNRLRVSVLSVTVSIMLLASLIPAQAFTTGFVIDFETFQHGEVINTQMQAQIPNGPIGLGVTIFGDNYWLPTAVPEYASDTNDPTVAPVYPTLGNIDTFDLAVAFDSDPADPFGVEDQDLLAFPFTSDFALSANRLIAPFPPGAANTPASEQDPGIILIIQDDQNIVNRCTQNPPTMCENPSSMVPLADDEGNRPAGQYIFVFTKEVILKSMDVFDIDADETDPTDIHFYDANNNFIGSSQILTVDLFGPSGNNKWRQVDLMQAGVKTMVIELAGSGAIDNIVYDLPIGGTVLPVDSTSLFVATASTNSFSILLALGAIGLAGLGTIYLSKTRK